MTSTQQRPPAVTGLPVTRQAAVKERRTRRSAGSVLGSIGKYGSLIVACLFALVPIVTIVMLAFKTSAEYRGTGPLTPPSNWFNLENFAIAFTQGGMVTGFLNTGIILVVSIVGTVLIGTMAAYAIDRFRFRGRSLVTGLFLLATLVPSVTTQVATFQVINALDLFNTRWSAILLFTGTDIVAIYIFLQFMQSIPVSLDEAAMLDGASRFTVYWRIVLPLLKPAIATVVIIKGIAVYNEFYIPFLYMPSRDLGVISTSLFRFMGPFGAQWEVIAAGTILVIVPTLIAFLFLQRFIYNGLTSGATK
ncbi:sugar ABC transporter permease [Rathayibacter sp. AY1E9]|uniref:carbohydrate ABC transporter permease n=1 Tax=unclassified Rathayibacter TaxID=2609250 RepID=UPI000CE7DEF5|nr:MULTISPECIES: carbohydrate ABC transporter permease [unclassified Rathayibacter]PPF16065.1 sugar ABC transporter permease [Rathayibacter sp. AY1A4]PPG08100.1 sugar ABC transporter permease [Rathayibacter sp. AY2B1]PPG51523.1 sugar ABC transporter permease [Rathayibacter sp. AY1E9]PPG55003.1 sugar ABC transporter permease [Rathayibacter sp. AY2B7]PPG68265.1 sugar ABC transporter permease [Rathayibacter sp. AY1F4]